jgi:hypothetical protein
MLIPSQKTAERLTPDDEGDEIGSAWRAASACARAGARERGAPGRAPTNVLQSSTAVSQALANAPFG